MRFDAAPLFGGIEVPIDAIANARAGCLDDVAGEVSIPGGRLDLCVPQELTNHRQTFAECQCPRSERMT